jgi:hypothetical protein
MHFFSSNNIKKERMKERRKKKGRKERKKKKKGKKMKEKGKKEIYKNTRRMPTVVSQSQLLSFTVIHCRVIINMGFAYFLMFKTS